MRCTLYSNQVFLICDSIEYDPYGIIKLDGKPIQTVFDSKDSSS